MDKEFEIVKIECLKDEEKNYKKVIRFCTTFGILNALALIVSIDSILNYNYSDSTLNNVLHVIAFASMPSTVLTFILDGLEIKEYRKFKEENKELLKKK